jgi:large subunit ribosomal protein L5
MKHLKELYETQVYDELKKDLSIDNHYLVPRLEKVVINIGMGDAAQNSKLMEEVIKHITLITAQKPMITRAKKSIAGFKVREGMPIGAKVTLRGMRMFLFLTKLVGVVIPRIRDFRGLSEAGFDGRGNYNLGLKDQLIFPEVEYDMVTRSRGMNITIVTSATNDSDALLLLTQLGFPFRKQRASNNAQAS